MAMTAERILVTLTLLALGLLATALAVAGGRPPSVASWVGSLPMPSLGGLASWAVLPRLPALPVFWPVGDAASLLVGVAAGWWLRWLYGLPWAALPRAVIGWLLGWRASAAMLGVAIGCTAILFFY